MRPRRADRISYPRPSNAASGSHLLRRGAVRRPGDSVWYTDTKPKIILLEANETPFRIFDDYLKKGAEVTSRN